MPQITKVGRSTFNMASGNSIALAAGSSGRGGRRGEARYGQPSHGTRELEQQPVEIEEAGGGATHGPILMQQAFAAAPLQRLGDALFLA